MNTRDVYTGIEIPEKVIKRFGRMTMYYVPYDVSENNGMYTYKYVSLTPDTYNYGGLIDAIIGTKYSLRDTLAIILNYMSDSNNEEYKSEFEELQKYRSFAKMEAKKYFNEN